MRHEISGLPQAPRLGVDLQTGSITGVHRVTAGHHLTVAAAIGATVLTLDDVADFIEGEGRTQVMVSGQVYDYDEVDPDTNTLTLSDPLTVAGAVDDPVDLFDPEVGGSVVVGYEAKIMLDDSDPTDRPIAVEISHSLAQMLAEDERGGFGEAATLMRVGEHKWTVWEVDGKIVANLLADEAVAAADLAFDKALEGLTAAQLAQAMIDGEVDIYYQTAAPWANGSTAHDDDTGDIWVDTDAATDTAYRWLNRTWTLIGDASLVAALLQAQSAQTTADGKIRMLVRTYFPVQDGADGHFGYGDLLKRSDLDNKEFYWDGDSWEELILGDDGIAATLTGKILRTAAAGNRIQMRQDSSAGVIEGFTGDSAGETYPMLINPTVYGSGGGRRMALDLQTGRFYPGGTYIGFLRLFSGTYDGSSGPQATFSVDQVNLPWVYVGSGLTVASGGLDINSGGLDVYGGGINVTNGISGFYDGCSISNGLTVNSGGILAGGQIEFNSLDGTGGSSYVMVGNDGVLSRGAPSSLRYKENVKPLDARVAEALLEVDAITWQYKDRKFHGDRTYAGVPAEQLHDLGLGLFVDYDDQGRPDQVRYWELVAPLIILCQRQQAQIDAVSAHLGRTS